jgi:hypothetical protein
VNDSCRTCLLAHRASTFWGMVVVTAIASGASQTSGLLTLAFAALLIDRCGPVIEGLRDWNADFECEGHDDG